MASRGPPPHPGREATVPRTLASSHRNVRAGEGFSMKGALPGCSRPPGGARMRWQDCRFAVIHSWLLEQDVPAISVRAIGAV